MKILHLPFLLLSLFIQSDAKSGQQPAVINNTTAQSTAAPSPNDPPLERLSFLDPLDPFILAKGIDEMKKHKVVIAGITRNNASDLPIIPFYGIN
jgi:hypothetical protein